jgi:hypothetical protein
MLKYCRIEIMMAQHVPPVIIISQRRVSKIPEHVRPFILFSNIIFVEVLFYNMVSLTRFFLYNSGKRVVGY